MLIILKRIHFHISVVFLFRIVFVLLQKKIIMTREELLERVLALSPGTEIDLSVIYYLLKPNDNERRLYSGVSSRYTLPD